MQQFPWWNFEILNEKKKEILESVDFTKTKESIYLENETFYLQLKKIINYTSRATLLQKIIL